MSVKDQLEEFKFDKTNGTGNKKIKKTSLSKLILKYLGNTILLIAGVIVLNAQFFLQTKNERQRVQKARDEFLLKQSVEK